MMLIWSCAWVDFCFESASHRRLSAKSSRCCLIGLTFDPERSLGTCWPRCSIAVSFLKLICQPKHFLIPSSFRRCFPEQSDVWSLGFQFGLAYVLLTLSESLDLAPKNGLLPGIWFSHQSCHILQIPRQLAAQATPYGSEQKSHPASQTCSCLKTDMVISTSISSEACLFRSTAPQSAYASPCLAPLRLLSANLRQAPALSFIACLRCCLSLRLYSLQNRHGLIRRGRIH